MRKTRHVVGAVAGMALLTGLTVGCGPSQAEKDLNAKMEASASRTEAAANRAEAAARSAADSAARAQAAADKTEAIFQKHMRK